MAGFQNLASYSFVLVRVFLHRHTPDDTDNFDCESLRQRRTSGICSHGTTYTPPAGHLISEDVVHQLPALGSNLWVRDPVCTCGNGTESAVKTTDSVVRSELFCFCSKVLSCWGTVRVKSETV